MAYAGIANENVLEKSMKESYVVVDQVADFEALRPEWDALLDSSNIPSPFLRWAWMFSWWEQFGSAEKDCQLAILTSRAADNRLTAIFPGYIRRERVGGRFVNVYAFLGNRYESTDYLEIIQEDPEDVSRASKMLLEIARRPDVDMIELINVLENRQFVEAAEKSADTLSARYVCRHHRVCPNIIISSDWDGFLGDLSKNMRYNVRRRSRNIVKKFDAQFEWIQEPAQLEDSIDQLFKLHEQRFESKNSATIFQGDGRKNFHKAVSRRFLKDGILRFSRLQVDGESIAMLYCYQYANELLYFQAGMNPEWEKQSAGMVLMAHNIQYAHDEGLRRFDFMRGGEEYKFKWTSDVRNMVRIDFSTSAKGRKALALRETAHQMKESVKRRLPEATWNKIKEFGSRS